MCRPPPMTKCARSPSRTAPERRRGTALRARLPAHPPLVCGGLRPPHPRRSDDLQDAREVIRRRGAKALRPNRSTRSSVGALPPRCSEGAQRGFEGCRLYSEGMGGRVSGGHPQMSSMAEALRRPKAASHEGGMRQYPERQPSRRHPSATNRARRRAEPYQRSGTLPSSRLPKVARNSMWRITSARESRPTTRPFCSTGSWWTSCSWRSRIASSRRDCGSTV